jgi:hypothetical protein
LEEERESELADELAVEAGEAGVEEVVELPLTASLVQQRSSI